MRRLPETGVYVVSITLSARAELTVGALGAMVLPRGTYLYVGSARRALRARVLRHTRREKALRWHVDYLTSLAPANEAWGWSDGVVSECGLAQALCQVTDVVRGFGASDCRCSGHLFHDSTGEGRALLMRMRPDAVWVAEELAQGL